LFDGRQMDVTVDRVDDQLITAFLRGRGHSP
jgi:hypothetical protein